MKKLFALINTEGKSKEQIVNETWEAYQNYSQAEKKISPKKFRKPFLVLAVIIIVLAAYFYFFRTDNPQVVESQQANTSIPVSPEGLEELKKDPTAPDWLKKAESCSWIGEKVFCKLKGE